MRGSSKKIAVGAVIAVAAVLVIIGLVHDDPAPPPIALEGARPLPALRGTDLTSGEAIDVAAMRGKPLFINVWAEWCLECRDEAPVLTEFARTHPEVRLLGIVGNSGRKRALRVNAELGWPWQSIYDPNGQVGLVRLNVQNYPTTIFVDSSGVERGRKVGVVTPEELVDVAARIG